MNSPINCSIYISNLPFNTNPTKIRQLFDDYEPVIKVYIPRNVKNGRYKKFGFIIFPSIQSAKRIICIHRYGTGFTINGHRLNMHLSTTYRKSSDQMAFEFQQRRALSIESIRMPCVWCSLTGCINNNRTFPLSLPNPPPRSDNRFNRPRACSLSRNFEY